MPGNKITSQQVEIYMENRKIGNSQKLSSAKAGISERSGRNIEKGKFQASTPHDWRTKPDPFDKVWKQELLPLLSNNPSLSALTLLEMLQEKYIGQYPDSLLRTMQRRVKNWKALHGPEKEVIFRQEHEPGRLGLSDFTQLKNIEVTINGEILNHILYHFRLSYSGWSYMKIILGGESFSALAEGLQEALWRLGGNPYEHRTDSLSAAFKNLSSNEQQDITERYEELCSHYNMKATRNNRGVSHENGSIESPHGHLKKRICQALLLRGNNNFESIEAYQSWLDNVVNQHNRRNAKSVQVDKEALQLLPTYKTIEYTETLVKVTTSSTIDVRRVTYTVPSRLEGETLRVHIYHDRLCCYLGATHIITVNRIYPKNNARGMVVDYKHVIKSLSRKPQAFRYSRIRDNLLPNESYKQIWQYINDNMPRDIACKTMVGLLHIASENNCECLLAEEVLEMISSGKKFSLNYFQNKYKQLENPPNITVTQHELSSYDVFVNEEECHA